MLEIEKYIKKHVGRKVLLTLTFSPSPSGGSGGSGGGTGCNMLVVLMTTRVVWW